MLPDIPIFLLWFLELKKGTRDIKMRKEQAWCFWLREKIKTTSEKNSAPTKN
jgi:hypothetical protein